MEVLKKQDDRTGSIVSHQSSPFQGAAHPRGTTIFKTNDYSEILVLSQSLIPVVDLYATYRGTSLVVYALLLSNFAKLTTPAKGLGRGLCMHAPENNLGLLLERKRHSREQH
jgi:hypothetical protein